MIAPIGPEPQKPTRNDGVSGAGQGGPPAGNGEGALPAVGNQSAALLAKGLRWGIGRHKRRRVVEQLCRWVDSDDARTSIAACKALIQADGINVKREQGPPQTMVAVGVAVGVSQSVEAALHEPDYLDWLEAGGNARPVRTSGDGGQVHNSGPHSSN